MKFNLIEIKNQEKKQTKKQNQHFPTDFVFCPLFVFKGIYVVDYKNERPVLLKRRSPIRLVNFFSRFPISFYIGLIHAVSDCLIDDDTKSPRVDRLITLSTFYHRMIKSSSLYFWRLRILDNFFFFIDFR